MIYDWVIPWKCPICGKIVDRICTKMACACGYKEEIEFDYIKMNAEYKAAGSELASERQIKGGKLT